jgi:hypothetical protein
MSEDKKLPTHSSSNQVQLHDSGLRAGSLVEQAIRELNPEQASNLRVKAGEEALRLEVKNREQNMDYGIGRQVTIDHIDTFRMLDKSGKLTRQSVVTDIKTGAGNMRIESKSGATCFVASVAYDDPNHPDVMFLRLFRDASLRHHQFGKAFIDWYWRNGPKLAIFVGKSRLLRNIARAHIAGIVFVIKCLWKPLEINHYD